MAQNSEEIQGYKDYLNWLILDATVIAGKESLGFLDALKCSISIDLIFIEKTWKGIKTVLFKI